MSTPEVRNFEPKEAVNLLPPKTDPITVAELAKCDGTGPLTYVAIKRVVFDVSGNSSYAVGGSYHVFAGKDASRALAMSSVKPEDVAPEWEDLSDKEKGVLDDWFSFFAKRYNKVGLVV
ncbi:hypothetical protein Q9L58_005203 [Maublancomyces gigas]|uniref:Cytochrome b5 heme-binding domain-containing protein n=1 Tax=Discina gigas TaxID=1032678 RepID=A0ABR3GJZ0_9PEZI